MPKNKKRLFCFENKNGDESEDPIAILFCVL